MSVGAYIATYTQSCMFEPGRHFLCFFLFCCLHKGGRQLYWSVLLSNVIKDGGTSSHPPTVPFPRVVLHHVYVAIRTGDGGLVLLQMCAAKL